MVRDYELMYIVRPDVDDDALRAAVDSVRTLVEGQAGAVRKTTMWGKRRLAYEVSHLRDGHYVIVEMRLDGSKVAAVERALRIHDAVFRHLLVVQEAPSAEIEGEGVTVEDGTAVTGEGFEAPEGAPAAAEAPEAPEAPAATEAPEAHEPAEEEQHLETAPVGSAAEGEEE
jgi:small subunit ribosomal protein S6